MDYNEELANQDMGALQYVSPDQSSMLLQLNSEDIIQQLKDFFDGVNERNKNGEVISKGAPRVRPRLRHALLGITSSVVNRNTNLSFFDNQEINEMMVDTMKGVIETMMMMHDQIDDDQFSIVLLAIENMIYSSLKRAWKGKERETARTQMQDVTQRVYKDQKNESEGGVKEWLKRTR